MFSLENELPHKPAPYIPQETPENIKLVPQELKIHFNKPCPGPSSSFHIKLFSRQLLD